MWNASRWTLLSSRLPMRTKRRSWTYGASIVRRRLTSNGNDDVEERGIPFRASFLVHTLIEECSVLLFLSSHSMTSSCRALLAACRSNERHRPLPWTLIDFDTQPEGLFLRRALMSRLGVDEFTSTLFVGGEHIGSYEDLCRHLEQNNFKSIYDLMEKEWDKRHMSFLKQTFPEVFEPISPEVLRRKFSYEDSVKK